MKAQARFECSACGTTHAHFTLAQQCCLPLVFQVYVCAACGRKHGPSQAAAEACCRPQMLCAAAAAVLVAE